MVPAASEDRFVAAPVGTYVSGPNYLIWCSARDLCGTTVWGRPSDDDAHKLVRLWDYDDRLASGFGSLTDLSRLDGVDPTAFEVVTEYTRRRLAAYAARSRRHAIVYPTGLVGAVVAGFYPMLEPAHAWKIFADSAAALAWLGRSESPTPAELDQLVERAIDVPVTLRRMRVWLSNHLVDANIDIAALAVASSVRSLQRELTSAGTSFSVELERARATEAARLLGETTLKAELIALRVGCTPVGLTKMLKRILGKTPTQLRQHARND